jgi:hypothetical protein
MKAQGRERGTTVKWTEEEVTSKKSWVNLITFDLWEKIAETIHLGSEYPKGTQTVSKHVTYSAYLNKVVEQIRLAAKNRFRTETEIFRIAIHIGIAVLYTIFITNKNVVKKSRGFFFYKALGELNKKMERATMISVVKEKSAELMEHIKKGSMDFDEANKDMKEFLDALDSDDKEYVTNFISTPKNDNIKNINENLLKKLMDCK